MSESLLQESSKRNMEFFVASWIGESSYIFSYFIRIIKREKINLFIKECSRIIIERYSERDIMRNNIIILRVINCRQTGIIIEATRERSRGDTLDVLIELVIKVRACIPVMNNGTCILTSLIVIARVHAFQRKSFRKTKIDFSPRIFYLIHNFSYKFYNFLIFIFINFLLYNK